MRAGVRDFDEFFAEHYPAVVRSLHLAIGDPQRAEDVTQEAFARALARWRRVRDMDRPVGWVYVVAMNAARSSFRRERRDEALPAPVAVAADPAGSVATAVSVREAVATLAPRQRAAVVLRYLGGLTLDEVAEAMRCTVGTVKATLHHALRNLRVEMEDDDEDR